VKASPHTASHGVQLPLYHPGPATCYATLRLAGSLPAHVMRELMEHKQACKNALARIAETPNRAVVCAEEDLSCLEELDRHLMKHQSGPAWLYEPAVADMVSEALREKDGTDYDLLLYCIMPNHLHCVVDTGRFHGQEEYAPRVLSTVKRHTAHEANAILKRTGIFWEHDHLEYPVRTSDCFSRILWDVLADPVRADLCTAWHEWPWSYCRPGLVVTSGI
jgi:putative transposase